MLAEYRNGSLGGGSVTRLREALQPDAQPTLL